MTTMTISQASELIWDLLQTLEDAYWEAGNCEEKDQIFNLMQLLNAEYMELLKISIQDHHYEYEVISTGLSALQQALEDFQPVALQKTRRQSTALRLNTFLNKLSANLSSK